jgi:hypothetical protein
MPNLSLTRVVVLSAVVGLAACSSGSSAVPAAGAQSAQSASIARSAPRVVLAKSMERPANCPTIYLTCATVRFHYSDDVSLCVDYNSSCDTQNTWYWSYKMTRLNGGRTTQVQAQFYPNPSNPVGDTIYERNPLKSSHGQVKYVEKVTACDQSKTCYGPYKIGVITD